MKTTKISKPVILNDANLEKCGWLFSATLGIMVREHELGNGKWDVEVDHYINVNTPDDPAWSPDTGVSYPAYKTVAEVLADPDNKDIVAAKDWVDGDTVNFW